MVRFLPQKNSITIKDLQWDHPLMGEDFQDQEDRDHHMIFMVHDLQCITVDYLKDLVTTKREIGEINLLIFKDNFQDLGFILITVVLILMGHHLLICGVHDPIFTMVPMMVQCLHGMKGAGKEGINSSVFCLSLIHI